MSAIRSHSPSSESDQLLPSSGSTQEVSKSANPIARLDMVPTQRDKLAFSAIIVGILLFLPLAWYMTLSTGFSAGWFTFHPPLQSLSIVLFILGITPLQPPPTSSSTRASRFNVHQTLILGVAMPLMTLGVIAMYINKAVHSAAHFTTWHSWFGLATLGWIFVQGLIGGLSVWWGGKAFGGESKAKRVYKYHRLSGYLLVTLALLTAHLGGAQSTWALSKDMRGIRVAAFWVGLGLIWVGFVARSRPSKMKIA